MDVGDGQVAISIDISPSGTRHPSAFASDSKCEDIASRLAFKVSGKSTDGKSFIYHPHQRGQKIVSKANTLADVLVNGIPLDELAELPRRYLFFKKGKAPEGLEKFEGGKYTSDSSNVD